MQDLSTVWQHLLGEMIWGVGRGFGSFLHIEFGPPHLEVREPIVPRHAQSEKARRLLLRRHAYVEDDYTLWIKYGDWRLQTAHGELTSETSSDPAADECLRDLDGQRLLAVEAGPRPNGTTFKFDLGAVLEVWPSAEIPDDQWSLRSRDGTAISMRHDGSLQAEPRAGQQA